MNSDHEIEVTEETSAPAEALETASETNLDHAAAATVEAADLSEHDEDGDEEGDEADEDEDDEEDGHEDSVKAEASDADEGDDEESEDEESEEDEDKHVAA